MRDIRRAIGQRMKQAALALGWDHPREIMARMDVSETTVYRWWTGERLPSDERMEEYAALVGAEVAAFFGEQVLMGTPGEVPAGLSPGDWAALTEEERASIRLLVRGLAELRRREAALAPAAAPPAGPSPASPAAPA